MHARNRTVLAVPALSDGMASKQHMPFQSATQATMSAQHVHRHGMLRNRPHSIPSIAYFTRQDIQRRWMRGLTLTLGFFRSRLR